MYGGNTVVAPKHHQSYKTFVLAHFHSRHVGCVCLLLDSIFELKLQLLIDFNFKRYNNNHRTLDVKLALFSSNISYMQLHLQYMQSDLLHQRHIHFTNHQLYY